MKLGANFARHLAPGNVLVPHLNNYFANAKFPDEIPLVLRPNKEHDNAFHPSSALMCARELFARRREDLVPGKNSVDAEKTFMVGRMYHELLQWVVVEGLGFATWADIEKEFDFGWDKDTEDFNGQLSTLNGNPYRIRGFLDIARCVIPNAGTYLVDIKTMMARLYAQNGLPAGKEEAYEAQVKIYLEFEELDKALILCVEKDNPHRFKEVTVERDPDFVADVIEKWETVVDALAVGEPPACTCLNPSKCVTRDLYIDIIRTTKQSS